MREGRLTHMRRRPFGVVAYSNNRGREIASGSRKNDAERDFVAMRQILAPIPS